MRKVFISGFVILLISGCKQNNKQLSITDDIDSLKEISEIKFENNTENESFPQDSFYSLLNGSIDSLKEISEIKFENNTENESFPQDSFYSLLNGSYNFPDTIINNIPINSSNYFSSINFPYYFPQNLRLDYFCKKIPFKLSDFYIFNKKNNSMACEYIALIDTSNFSKIIAEQCVDMENWVILYTISKDYRIIDKELLMVVGGEVDDVALSFDNKTIEYSDYIDSLKFEDGIYTVSRSEIFTINQESGKSYEDIGYQTIKILKVNSNGIIIHSDSVSIKKDYISKYEELNNYRFK